MQKIQPETYTKILNGIELKNIHLESFKGKLDLKVKPKSPVVDISGKANFTTGHDDCIEVSQEWTIIGKDIETKSQFLEISVTYCLILTSQEEFSKDFFEIYERTSLPLNTWPFVREFVNSMTARMNIPPLTLPLLKFTQQTQTKSDS